MTINSELNTLSSAIENIKTEIIEQGQTVLETDTVASLSPKIDLISNKNGDPYSKSVLNDIIEGTIKYLYDEILLYIRPYCFCGCDLLHTAYFTQLRKICRHAFDSCYMLENLVLASNNMVILDDINAFKNTKIAKGTGSIYVTDALLNTYLADDKWSVFSNSLKNLSQFSN